MKSSSAPRPWAALALAVLAAGCAGRSSPSPRADVSLEPAEPAVVVPGPLTPIYHVQIYSGDDPGAAEEIASRARARLEGPVTVVRAGGGVRVRVGSFGSPGEADGLLRLLREMGYRSAVRVSSEAVPPPSG